jgi:hypothetical protein
VAPEANSLPPETWLDLEKLAARIYAELEPGARVTHNASIVGTFSGASRQIDVLIENEELGTRVVVDCKDHRRPVNIISAGAFASLLEDVEATAGVLVCNKGFSKATLTYAKKKGFDLARLHDVESRKWNLDVLLPIIWRRLRLADLSVGVLVHMEAGMTVETNKPLQLSKDGVPVDVVSFFERAWNVGQLHRGNPGDGELEATLDIELADGVVRPDAKVTIKYAAAGDARLGYVTPQQSRGMLDEASGAYMTAHLDVGATVEQEPAGGWKPVFDPDDLAVRLKGTVITLEETEGVTVHMSGINEVRGAEAHNKGVRWARDQGP